MIRTAIILSPRQEAADRLYFHANGLQIDVATASQSIVRTSHRPVQIYSATRSGFRQQASNLTAQTGFQGQRWQRLMDILDRQGSDALQGLFTDGELTGEWIAALDDRKLNALLSDRFSFYLFRGGNLRELRPIAQLLPIDNGLPMNLYRIRISQDDQIMIMPKDLITQTLLPDVMQILLGMHQLPVRMSELGARLRERGVTTPYTGWLALQVLRAEAEYTIPERGLRAWLIGRRRSVDNEKGLGFSDSFTPESSKSSNDPDNEDEREIEAGRNTYPNISSAPRTAMIIVMIVIGIALLTLLFRVVLKPPADPSATTATTTQLVTTSSTVRPTPTVTPRPTTTAPTTAALPEWYVIAKKLNLRSEPKLTSTLIRTLTTGQLVYILEQTNAEWTKVRTPENETGYVYAAYISKDKPAG